MRRGWLFGVVLALISATAIAGATGRALPTVHSVRDLSEPSFQSVGSEAIARDVVATITQDPAGFIWLASGDGLLRYDGHRFRLMERDSADPKARNLGWVLAMAAGLDGRLWIGTEVAGLVAYDPATDRFVDHRWAAAMGSPMPTISALAADPDGSLWVGTLESGLLRINTAKTSQIQPSDRQRLPGLSDNRIGALLIDRSANLWVGTDRGLGLRRQGTDRVEVVPLGLSAAGVQPAVQALLQAADGAIWVGTAEGALFKISPDADQAVPVLAHRTDDSADDSTAAVTSLLQSPDGTLWVGRTTGINWHDAQSGQLLRQIRPDPRRHQGLAGAHVTSLLLDRAGSIWVAGLGLGLQRHEPGGAIGLRGVDLDPGSPFSTADTRALLQLRSGDVWAAEHPTGLVVMDSQLRTQGRGGPAGGKPLGRDITAMLQAEDGSVWLGSTGQLLRVNPDRHVLGRYAHGGGVTNHLTQGPDGSL